MTEAKIFFLMFEGVRGLRQVHRGHLPRLRRRHLQVESRAGDNRKKTFSNSSLTIDYWLNDTQDNDTQHTTLIL
jgi:hypothetical protein